MQIVLLSMTSVALDDNPNAYVWLHYKQNNSPEKLREHRIVYCLVRATLCTRSRYPEKRNETNFVQLIFFLFFNRRSHSVHIGYRNMPHEFCFFLFLFFVLLRWIQSFLFWFLFSWYRNVCVFSWSFEKKIENKNKVPREWKRAMGKWNGWPIKSHTCAVCWRRKFRSWFFDLLWPNVTPLSAEL